MLLPRSGDGCDGNYALEIVIQIATKTERGRHSEQRKKKTLSFYELLAFGLKQIA